ncbi:unnamed protein product [Arabidopsis lyrata]|nr:unnamed protein product [Arabidopsis lyrata]
MEQKPGFRFQPTDEELINYYLKNKIMGNTWLVDDTICEINILNHHPSSFSSLSRIKSNDSIYYFFVPKQYKTETVRKRNTKEKYWYWKHSGRVKVIEDESGNKIGERQGFLYQKYGDPKTKGNKSRWVMHEYKITSLPHHNLDSYVICKIFDKGKEADIQNGNSLSVASQSLVSDLNTISVSTSILPEVEQPGQESLTPYLAQEDDEFLRGLPPAYRGTAQHFLSDQEMQEMYIDSRPKDSVRAINTEPEIEQPGQENVHDLGVPMNEQEDLFPRNAFDPRNDEYWSGLLSYNGGNFEDVFPDQEFIMQENRNDYRPKISLSGIIVDYSSDSDSYAESMSATSYKGTSSPIDTVGSSNRHFLKTCGDEILSLSKDIQISDEPSISRKTRESQLAQCTISSKLEFLS